MSNFDQSFAFLLIDEGGFSNNPNDSGGATNWGITQYDLAKFLGRPVTIDEVKSMSQATAKSIYQAYYWDPLGLDRITLYAKACAIFDIAVVCGLGVGSRLAQEACNMSGAGLVIDGHLGPLSAGAINGAPNMAFIRDISEILEARFNAIAERNPNDQVFLKGWIARARRLLTLAS